MSEMFLSDRQLRYLTAIANDKQVIDGSVPEIKRNFLVLCFALGLQLAEDCGLKDVTGVISPGNDGTSGEVEVYGTDTWSGLVARFTFFQPEISHSLWQKGYEKESGFACFTVALGAIEKPLPVLYDNISNYDTELDFIQHWLTQSASFQNLAGGMHNLAVDEIITGEYDEQPSV